MKRIALILAKLFAVCAALGLDYDTIAETFAPLCTKVASITTAESFDDLAG